jgi:hypothetical protein
MGLWSLLVQYCSTTSIGWIFVPRLCPELRLLRYWHCALLFDICLCTHAVTQKLSAWTVSTATPPAPHLRSLYLRGCVLPARAFDAPELTRLLASPHLSWEGLIFGGKRMTSGLGPQTITRKSFPNTFLSCDSWPLALGGRDEMDYLEPSIRLIRAHPDTNEISLYGHDGPCKLLRNACRLTLYGDSTAHSPTSFGDELGAGVALEDDTGWEVQVSNAMSSLIVHSPLVGTSLWCRRLPGLCLFIDGISWALFH